MSLSTSLSSALSGLNSAARSAEVVSNNIANALNESYARRELVLSSNAYSGVRISGVKRILDQAVLNDRRMSMAEAGNASTSLAFLRRVETTIGTPDQASSLSGRIAALEATILDAASRPESEAHLSKVLTAAQSVAQTFNTASNDIQAARSDADRTIAIEVSTLNTALDLVADLNRQIMTVGASGRDISPLLDQRQQLVDQIATIVPIREVPRDNNQIAIFTAGGAILLDGAPSHVEFSPAGLITADMTVASGALSTLSINGQPADRMLAGGSLSAHFQVRDVLAVEAQAQLDALARNLIERMADPSADPTLAAGAPGLFTDLGAMPDPLDEAGLAGRLRVNTAADPASGGDLWRLRAGLGATAPGEAGDARRLNALAEALSQPGTTASGNFGATSKSFGGLAGEMISMLGTQRQGLETRASFATARVETLRLAELQGGVDTDQELQRLLLIEQAYSANARVIQAVDDMINTILRL
ncbi:flagellar hook-associated protein FlgK [Halodurantibacterium flavum]|uniref:Flagellar hook-associated protein 1 n=1 Tax=Halodurantibacterium flavum TaxID=1382802 RepID=A0ABW4S7R4_9RHOB